MVGVGGRSKACDHCRRRRVKCDQTIPTCLRCRKAKLKCGGYVGIAIIQYGAKNRSEQGKAPASNPSDSELASSLAPVLDYSLPIDCDDVFLSYTRFQLFREEHWADQNVIIQNRGLDSLESTSFLALATTYYGSDHMDKEYVERGYQRYGHALQHLNRILRNPSMPFDTEITKATIPSTFESNRGLTLFLIADEEGAPTLDSVVAGPLILTSQPSEASMAV